MRSRTCWVYIMANSWTRVLYIGVTSDLERRVWEHKTYAHEGFTARYNVTSLVYYEEHSGPSEAIAREKELKGWRRAKKVALIEAMDPRWEDLAAGWFDDAAVREAATPGGRIPPPRRVGGAADLKGPCGGSSSE